MRRLQVFEHRCFRSFDGFGWRQRVSNEVIRKRVFGCAKGTSIAEKVEHDRLRRLSHVLRMPKYHLRRRVLFSMSPSEWRKPRGEQHMTWQKGVKEITKSLGVVGSVRLPGWGPMTPPVLGWKHCKKWRLIDASGSRTSIAEKVEHDRLRRLSHVLRMPKYHLRRRVLFSMSPSEWRKPRGEQHMTWQKGVKEITKSLGVVGSVRLPGWGPMTPPVLGWKHCKKWRLIDASGSRAFSFFQDCLIGRLDSLMEIVVNRIQFFFIIMNIIIDSMTSVFNTDASLPYNHDLFESLIAKKRIKRLQPGTEKITGSPSCKASSTDNTQTFRDFFHTKRLGHEETGPYRGVTVCAPQRPIELYWRMSPRHSRSLLYQVSQWLKV
ncbi:hypothetical protein CSKR_113716 [Clonorchis sinensis]|uniref:Uncharacterized protein n=1 Tax=Clonorchis sinensis TaxID=79923 RepID=A0A3R7JGH5_CLOSI|nr:hypothetical protein CSKR_113716 [Clonorchis sinensis]